MFVHTNSTMNHDYRIVNISGIVEDEYELPKIIEYFNSDKGPKIFAFTPESNPNHLGHWINKLSTLGISKSALLSQCDVSISDIHTELYQIAAKFPSLRLEVLVGGPYKNIECEATMIVVNGKCYLHGPSAGRKLLKFNMERS